MVIVVEPYFSEKGLDFYDFASAWIIGNPDNLMLQDYMTGYL